MSEGIAILRFDAAGEMQLSIWGGARFLVIDERCPADRLFQVTAEVSSEEFTALVPPGSKVGSAGDGSLSDELAAVIARAAAPAPKLTMIEGGAA